MRFRSQRRRAGNVLVLSAVMMAAMCAMLAFAVDLGYVFVGQTELRRTADSAAIAAASELLAERRQDAAAFAGPSSNVAAVARQYAELNPVTRVGPGLADADILVGTLADFHAPTSAIISNDPAGANTVEIRVRRTVEQNGEIPFFFARVLGFEGQSLTVSSRARFHSGFSGFRLTDSHKDFPILPFALDKETWVAWKEQDCDLVPKYPLINLFPQGTGAPGNRGTVNIGVFNNSTNVVRNQIYNGVTAEQLAIHSDDPDQLTMSEANPFVLTGNPGISAGFKSALDDIEGDTRLIPIFSEVKLQGSIAEYTIVKWINVKIGEVNLTGSMSSKRLMVRPTCRVMTGLIPAPPGESTMHYVFSPVQLIQ